VEQEPLIRRWLKGFGPGLITGAADDDPSGIATYTQTGAQFGYSQLWAAVIMLPLASFVAVRARAAGARCGVMTFAPSAVLGPAWLSNYRGREERDVITGIGRSGAWLNETSRERAYLTKLQ
jgi:hypothetical protein